MRAGVTIGLPDTLPCCYPTAATAPPPPAPLFPPLTDAWARATTNPLPRPLAAERLGTGAESAGALLSTSVDAVSSAKQAKLVASSTNYEPPVRAFCTSRTVSSPSHADSETTFEA